MSIEAARQYILEAQATLDRALIELESQPAPPPIATPEEFDRALAEATAGAVLVCATTLRYAAPLTVGKSNLTIRSERASDPA
jgi:hypothetical protein